MLQRLRLNARANTGAILDTAVHTSKLSFYNWNNTEQGLNGSTKDIMSVPTWIATQQEYRHALEWTVEGQPKFHSTGFQATSRTSS